MKFVRIEMLFLIWSLPLLAAIILYGARRRKRILDTHAFGKARLAIGQEADEKKRWIKWSLLLAGLLFMTFSLAGPQYGYQWEEMEQHGIDMIIALDCSKSMLAADISPTRLDRAKREVVDLLSMLKGDRVGLVAFSGTAFLQCPLTLDYQAFYLFLDTLTPGFLPVGGTDIGKAIDGAISGFNVQENTQKAIIMITDGENTGQDPEPALKKAKAAGIKIFTIGVGQEAGAPVPSEEGGLMKDGQGKIVVSRIDEAMLKQMAEFTGGIYVRSVAGDMDLEAIYEKEIRGKMEASTLSSGKKQVWQDRYQWFLIFAILAFLAEGLISGAKTRGVSGKILPLVFCFLLLGQADPAHGRSVYGMVKDGKAAFDKGDYEAALKHFIDALVHAPDRPEAYYNIGNAYYKLGNYDAAIHNYTEALRTRDETLKQKIHYNLGNAKFRKQMLADAISEYETALQLNAEDQQAQDNLAFVKKMRQQQEQRQTKEPSEKSSDEKEPKDQNDPKDKGEKETAEPLEKDEENPEPDADEKGPREPGEMDETNPSPPEDSETSSGSGEDPANNDARPSYGKEMDPDDEHKNDQGPDSGRGSTEDRDQAASRGENEPNTKMEPSRSDRMLNRLKDSPGKALMPRYAPGEVEKDW